MLPLSKKIIDSLITTLRELVPVQCSGLIWDHHTQTEPCGPKPKDRGVVDLALCDKIPVWHLLQ